MKKVGIQAIAINCALGSDLNIIWENICQGHSPGMSASSKYLPTVLGHVEFKSQQISADFDSRINQLLISAFKQVESQYKSLIKNVNSDRIGIVLGTSTSAVDELEAAVKSYDDNKQWPQNYQSYYQRMGCVTECLADYLSVSGPAMSISTACSSSAKAIVTAKKWLNQGVCDVVITGGVDVLCELTVKGFHSLGALSDELTNPFSQNRKGINIGEGVALMILTTESAPVNILGTGLSSDAHHISAPDPSGQGAIDAMKFALIDANLKADDIDYINLHGTGTIQNDAMESLAVNAVFGDDTPCSSSKALIGHTLGAAGALELALTALSMSEINHAGQYLPHYYDQQFDSQLSPIKLVSQNNSLGRPRHCLSNSFAFGGNNAVVILGGA